MWNEAERNGETLFGPGSKYNGSDSPTSPCNGTPLIATVAYAAGITRRVIYERKKETESKHSRKLIL
jgi:hypothetical protein